MFWRCSIRQCQQIVVLGWSCMLCVIIASRCIAWYCTLGVHVWVVHARGM